MICCWVKEAQLIDEILIVNNNALLHSCFLRFIGVMKFSALNTGVMKKYEHLFAWFECDK